MMRHRTTAATVLAVLVLAGCGSSHHAKQPPAKVEVRGSLTITDPSNFMLEDGGSTMAAGAHGPCLGLSGYGDIVPGAQVTVTDDSGRTIAVGSLDAGSVTPDGACRFTFTVPAPSGAEFFGVEVTHRGIVQFPADEVGRADLTL
jgi:hypothetical protein